MTNENKFLAPWAIGQENGVLCEILNTQDELVARVFVGETLADARLIAAAPTMFDYVQLRADAGCPEAIKILEAINARS